MKGRALIVRECLCALVALLFVCTNALAAEWFTLSPDGQLVPDQTSLPTDPGLAVNRADETGVAVSVQLAGVVLDARQHEAGAFTSVTWPESATLGEIGQPALPVMRRLLVVPNGATFALDVTAGQPMRVDLAAAGYPAMVDPLQAPVPKIPGAWENAPFDFDAAAYTIDALQPAERVQVTELGIVRGHRLALLEIRPVAYNPVRGQLVLWPQIEAAVSFANGRGVSEAARPLAPLGGVLLNPPAMAAARDLGNYLIVVPTTFESGITALVSAKINRGFNVLTHVIAPGTSNTVIKGYIESLWGTADQPDYILLVGDTNSIPAWTGQGTGSPDTDIQYACMDGSGDWYPDIPIGRFPVRTPEQLTDVITKTIFFEEGNYPDPEYLVRAVFMASEDNYQVSEGTHNYCIENYLDPAGFTSDKLYCHTYNATTQQVRDSFNDGRIYGIYSGHGGTYSWADGPPFSQSDVEGLWNDGLYPFVCSFACVTGTYTVTECFTETWILQPNKAAAAIYGSSVNSYWTEDDILQKRLFDVIYLDDIREVSPAWQACLLLYLDHFGPTGQTRRYFEMYNLMGDPSLFIPYPGGGHSMRVTPAGSYAAEGPNGGPFTPPSTVYTVINNAEFPIDYEVSADQTWVSIDSPTGTVPVGSFADVTVSIAAEAEGFANGHYEAIVSFANVTDHDGDTLRLVTLDVGVPEPIHIYDLDIEPPCYMEGEWEFGQPLGQGGDSYGNPDPTSGATGINVIGVNLAGDYSTVPGGPWYAMLRRIDCSDLYQTQLRFMRWLNTDYQPYTYATVDVTNDGTNWVSLWDNGDGTIADSSWSEQVFDISAVADGEPFVYVRWGYEIGSGAWAYSGWNIDDIEIWGVPPSGPDCPADLNGDGVVDVTDFLQLLAVWGQSGVPEDINGDGIVDILDFLELIASWGPC
ncbi:MAG: C25 family cysteine peptidase [Planctomycetota bacterium]